MSRYKAHEGPEWVTNPAHGIGRCVLRRTKRVDCQGRDEIELTHLGGLGLLSSGEEGVGDGAL